MTRYLCFTRVFSKENVSRVSTEERLHVRTFRQSHWWLIPEIYTVSVSNLFVFVYPQSHLGNVLVDMKLIDIKDTLPVGFIPIQETVDTRM